MVTCDGAGASHGLITRLDQLASRPGHQLTYSVGWDLSAREREAITAVPEQSNPRHRAPGQLNHETLHDLTMPPESPPARQEPQITTGGRVSGTDRCRRAAEGGMGELVKRG